MTMDVHDAWDGRPDASGRHRQVTPYLDALDATLARARATNAESLVVAARLVGTAVGRDGIVFVFGSGHSQLAALELSRRAGGLAPLQVIFDPTWGAAEQLEGYGETLVAGIAPRPCDCLVVVSHSGVTAAPLAIARWGRAHGLPVVAVTSLDASRSGSAGRAPAPRLCDLVDVVLDNGATGGDANVRVDGCDPALGPTSTVVAAAMLHEVVVSAVRGLAARGVEAPVLRPNAEAGGPAHNAALLDRYRGRLQRVP